MAKVHAAQQRADGHRPVDSIVEPVPTAHGPARLTVGFPRADPTAVLVLGHGAGGAIDAPDLLAVRGAALDAGLVVARVTQPYRVAGRRAPAPAAQLDTAWVAVLAMLGSRRRPRSRRPLRSLPLIVGGRSSGARVACRTVDATGAAGVLALAFPLHPPGRPERTRAGELPLSVPTLVINGDRDPFGAPEAAGPVEVVLRPGERHDLARDPAGTAAAATAWLARHGWVGGIPG